MNDSPPSAGSAFAQHQRVTKADAVLEKAVLAFQVGDGPTTTHLVGAHRRG